MRNKFSKISNTLGPGLLVAAAGIGAGDMIVGIQIGINFNLLFVSVVLITCILKYTLTEGVARRLLISDESIIATWYRRFPRVIFYIAFVFFIIWSFMVAAALLSANGLAANSIIGKISISRWAMIHSFVAFITVFFGKYHLIELITKLLIAIMFLIIAFTAVRLIPDIIDQSQNFTSVTEFSTPTLLFAIIGGVGGSVTMLSYSYWMQEKKWTQIEDLGKVKFDLRFSYTITFLFLLFLMVIASSIEYTQEAQSGSQLVIGLSKVLANAIGPIGEALFKICFWGVVFSSLITVWSGIPYLFCDFINTQSKQKNNTPINSHSLTYRLFLVFITIAPIIMTFQLSAIKNVINYSLISAIFVFGLTITLLVANNRKEDMGAYINTNIVKVILTLGIVVFAALAIYQILR